MAISSSVCPVRPGKPLNRQSASCSTWTWITCRVMRRSLSQDGTRRDGQSPRLDPRRQMVGVRLRGIHSPNRHYDCEDVDYFRRKAFRSFYFRPGYILKKIFHDISLRQTLRLATRRLDESVGFRQLQIMTEPLVSVVIPVSMKSAPSPPVLPAQPRPSLASTPLAK